MKRNAFIRLLVVAGSIISLPLDVFAKINKQTRLNKGINVDMG